MCVFRPECFILVDLQGGGGIRFRVGGWEKKKALKIFRAFFLLFF